MENRIHLEEAMKKHCRLTGDSIIDVKRAIKKGLWCDSKVDNQNQYYAAIISGKRKGLRPIEYNWLCQNLTGCTEFLLNNGREK